MSDWNPDIDVILTDSEDEEDELKRNFRGREAVIFVVDSNLYENPERFMDALKLIHEAFISGLLVNDKDLLGIVFDNTEMSPEPYEPNCLDNIVVPDNCAVFLPLRQLTKPIVEHFMRFLRTAQSDFGTYYGVAGNEGSGSFAMMLRLCLNLFSHCGYTLIRSTIVYLTDRETPHGIQSDDYQMALQKAKDLQGNEIEFHVIPMVNEFNYDLFYKEFLTLARNIELDSFVPHDPKQLRQILSNRKLKQDFLKRCLGHFNFSLGPNLELSVQYYNYFQNSCYPKKVKLLRKNNTMVKQKTVIMLRKQDPATMEFTVDREVKPSELRYEIKFSDMPIRITPEQLVRVRNLHKPGMMLLGFKPKSAIPESLYCRPCNFMYPDDQSIAGSKRLFCALWQRCMARDKIAICIFMRKRRSIPRYVALVPVAASTADDETGEFRSLLSGDGFKIVYLPMAKHIRNIDFADWNSMENSSTDDGVEIFQKIIKKLRIKYRPDQYNDPTFEALESNLLALALNIKTENDGPTNTPDCGEQDKRIAQFIPNMSTIFGEDAEITAKKRTAKSAADGGDTGGNAPKMPKVSSEDIKRYEYVRQLVGANALSSCTIPMLRTILEDHFSEKLAKSASKQVLMDRIYEICI